MSVIEQTIERHTSCVPQTHLGSILREDGKSIQSIGIFVPTMFEGDTTGLLRLVDIVSPLYGYDPAKLVGRWAFRPLATDKTPNPIPTVAPLFAHEGCDVIVHAEPTPYAFVVALAGEGALRGFKVDC